MVKANVLIVEDNFLIAQDMQDILEGVGYYVPAVANTGIQAIEAAAKLKPDLIIMDIGLKGDMNGMETAKKIREQSIIPVLYVTGNKDQLKQNNLNEPCIDKPFTAGELTRSVTSILEASAK